MKVHRLHSQGGAPQGSMLAVASTELRDRLGAGSVRGARKRSMPALLLLPPLERPLPARPPAALAVEEHEQVQQAGVADASAAAALR